MSSPIPAAALLAVLSASPLAAQDVLGDLRGNWAAPANDGFSYRAVLTRQDGALRLRIWQAPDVAGVDANLQFDNAQIARHSVDDAIDRAWIEVLPNGALALNTLTYVEGYLYSERLILSFMDNQFTATAFASYNNWDLPATLPADPFRCLSASCYACEADLWNGSATAGGERITPPPQDAEALNASYWTDTRVFELGFCPQAD